MTPPDDCAIMVHYARRCRRFRLQRIRSHGSWYRDIDFERRTGSLWLHLPQDKHLHRFAISFRLPPGDTSGGFAGIKVWPKNGDMPSVFSLHLGYTAPIKGTPLDLHSYTTIPGKDKVTLMSLGDECSLLEEFNYCLGIYRNEEKKIIDHDDPRIYNNGVPPDDGGKRPRWRSWWRGLFGSGR